MLGFEPSTSWSQKLPLITTLPQQPPLVASSWASWSTSDLTKLNVIASNLYQEIIPNGTFQLLTTLFQISKLFWLPRFKNQFHAYRSNLGFLAYIVHWIILKYLAIYRNENLPNSKKICQIPKTVKIKLLKWQNLATYGLNAPKLARITVWSFLVEGDEQLDWPNSQTFM